MKEMKGAPLMLLLFISLSLLCFVSGNDIEFSLGRDVRMDGMALRVPRALKTQGESQREKAAREEEAPLCSLNGTGFLVEENAFGSSVTQFLWSPYNTDHVWVVTETKSLKMSKDGGEIWVNAREHVEAIFEGTGGEVLYATSLSSLMVTHDFVNWETLDLEFPLFLFAVHPTEPLWAAAIFLEGQCEDKKSPTCRFVLKWTKDGGETWEVVGSNVYSFTWGSAGSNGIPEESLIFLRSDLVLSRTIALGPNGAQWVNLLEKCYFMAYQNRVLIGLRVSDEKTAEVFESRDDGENFTIPRLPDDIKGKLVYLLEGPEGVSYLQVSDGTLFESSEDGSTYSLLLKHVVFSSENSGFHSMESLIGNFVTNVEAENEEGSLTGSWKTVISHEMGSEWFPIPVPEGMKCSEGEICFLNLYGQESGYPILSQQQAAGIIVANGHVGESLINPPKALRTSVFLSRDSGKIFEKIVDRPHYFGLGDHGGMLVMVESEETNELKYSENQGKEVETCVVTEKGVIVFDALFSEPSNKGLRFIAVGNRENGDGSESGVVISLDFTDYFERACGDGDYEAYSPKNMEGEHCLLGQKHTFIRRKRDANCFSPVTFEPEYNTTTCQCERDDYVCDYCYEEDSNQLCVKSTEELCADYDPTKPPEDCEGTYEIPTGYRKVPRNKCEGGSLDPWDQDPESRPCSSNFADDEDDSNPNSGANFFIFFYLLVAGGVVVIVCYVVTPIRKFFSSLLPTSETEDELFGESYKTVDAANAVSLLDSDEEGGNKDDDELFSGGNDEDAFLFGPEGGSGEGSEEDSDRKAVNLFGDLAEVGEEGEGGNSSALL